MSFPVFGVRPRLVPTVSAGLAFLVLIGLGTWQVERLQWKTALLRDIAERMSTEPTLLPGPPFAVMEYERVRATGHFLNDRELHLFARSDKGQIGYDILTPLVLDRGGAVLVNRGYVPTDRRDPATRRDGEVPGTVTVTGIVRIPRKPMLSWLLPDNKPDQNQWIWTDLPAMAASIGVQPLAPFVIEADATPNPGGLPVGGQTRLNIPNDHLQYALTWYALAAILAVMFVVYHRRQAKEGKQP
ncbi:MAG TPA: SURF1 family protein [Alphaproteobacteria bacterium]|nr:SURF1 family protein [Alphaproteobacteria bacterium]